MRPEGADNPAPQRMSRRLRRALELISLFAVVFMAAAAALLFQGAFGRQVDRDLERMTRAIAVGYESAAVQDPESLADYLPGSPLRLTLIDTDGTVLFDSDHRDESDMDNHLTRPEIAQALESGQGHSVRESPTLGQETHYYALRLESGQVLRLAEDTNSLWSSYNQVLPLLVGGGLVAILASAVLAAVFTRRLVEPITRMADHLETIEDNVPYVELIPLAHTIQSDRSLRENNEAMRREFTANVSHELKTPLTSISGFAELLETGMAKPEDVPVFGKRIHSEAGRMIRLVSDILELSQLDGMQAGADQPPAFAPVELSTRLRDVASTMTMNAKKAYVTLRYEVSPVTVQGSRDMLTELVTNLCDNAIRYNRPGGQVVLRCGPAGGGGAYVQVEDNGIGIPQDAQDRVFERFFRVDKSRSKATGGTGLGLAIVKHIAVLHGARIELHSTVGTGTTIRVNFPAGGTADKTL